MRVPEELLQPILLHMRPGSSTTYPGNDDATSTLATACLVNGAFRRHARPLLYRTLTLGWNALNGSACRRLLLTLLLLTLTWRPAFAHFVQEIRIISWENFVNPLDVRALLAPPGIDNVRPLEFEDIVSLLASKQSPRCPEDLIIAAILARCVNLSTLEILQQPTVVRRTAVMRLIDFWTSQDASTLPTGFQPPLSRLQTCILDWWPAHPGTNLASVWPLLRAPSLQRCNSSGIAYGRQYLSTPSAGGTSPLRYLDLTYLWLDFDGLKTLLDACPSLTTLHIHFWQFDGTLRYRLGELFCLHAPKLEELKVKVSDDTMTGPRGSETAHIRHLAARSSLKHLSVAQSLLLDTPEAILDPETRLDQSLPASLESLELWPCQNDQISIERLDAEILTLIRDSKFVSLNRITLRHKVSIQTRRMLDCDPEHQFPCSIKDRGWVVKRSEENRKPQGGLGASATWTYVLEEA